jgi:uncharacterized protein YegP (UPF0339 family)
MTRCFEIHVSKADEYAAYFRRNSQAIFCAEGFKAKRSAQTEICFILNNCSDA